MLSATIDTTLQVVVLDYNVVDIAGSPQFVTISRRSPSGAVSTVRGWAHSSVAAGLVVVRDFETPIGVQLVYTAQTEDQDGHVVDTQTVTVTVPPAGDCDTWLNDLARVGNTTQVVIEHLASLDFLVPNTVHDIITRRDPIVSSDIAHTPEFELAVLTGSLDERDRTRAILGNGVPALLRTSPDFGIGNLYFAVLGYSEQRVVTDGKVPDRRFVVSGRQVVRPDPTLYQPVGYASYQFVKDTFATYQDLFDERASYDAVLYDWAGTQPADIVPWPPSDA